VLNGNIHGEYLKENGFDNLNRNGSYTACFRMIGLARAALTPSSTSPLDQRLKDASITRLDVQRTPVMLFKTEGYLAFSKNIKDSVILQWQKALDQLKESGKYDQLIKTYFLLK